MRDIRGDLLLNGNQLINARAESISSDPAQNAAGRLIFNISDNLLKYNDGNEWVKLINPGRVMTIGKSGCDFNLDETSTPITDAINSISPSASNTERWLLKLYPGTYNENITIPEFVFIEGSGESSIINATNGTATVSFSNTGSSTCGIYNTRITSTNGYAVELDNFNLTARIFNCSFETTWNSSSETDRSIFRLISGNIEIYDSRALITDSIVNASNETYNSIVSLSGSGAVKLNIVGMTSQSTNTDIENHNIIFLKSENSNDGTRCKVISSQINLTNTTASTENIFSSSAIENARGKYEFVSNTILFEVSSTGALFLGFLGFVHNSLGTSNDTELLMSNNTFYCRNIDSGKLFIGSEGTQYDCTISSHNTIVTNTDFSIGKYSVIGTNGKVLFNDKNIFGNSFSSKTKVLTVPSNWTNRASQWSDMGGNEFVRYKQRLPVINRSGGGNNFFCITIPVPDDCKEIIELSSLFVPESQPNNGFSLEYEAVFTKDGVNENSWPNATPIIFQGVSYNLDVINRHIITGLIPTNELTDLAGEFIGLRVNFSGASWNDMYHIGFKLEYR